MIIFFFSDVRIRVQITCLCFVFKLKYISFGKQFFKANLVVYFAAFLRMADNSPMHNTFAQLLVNSIIAVLL